MVDIKKICNAHLHANRHVAQTNHLFYVRVTEHRFCHHACRICEIDQPCIRAERFHIPAYIEYHRNSAQSFEQPARPVRLLSKYPVLQRYTLVFCTCIELTDPELCGDKIRILQCFPAVECQMEINRQAGFLDHPFCQVTDSLQFFTRSEETRLNSSHVSISYAFFC